MGLGLSLDYCKAVGFEFTGDGTWWVWTPLPKLPWPAWRQFAAVALLARFAADEVWGVESGREPMKLLMML